MPHINIAGVRKCFGPVAALDGVHLDIAEGEHLAVLGPSGSGKSTLLRVIAGLETPDAGSVTFNGQLQNGIPPHLRDSAIVFQHFALYPHLSSLDNITLGLRHGLGLSKATAERRAREVAARMHVEHLLDRKPKAMSGGQRQRIALARALARQSGIVLLDEPLSGLDAQLHAVLRLEIAALLRSVGATAVNVTHDQLDAMAMADRIAVIRDGVIEQMGTPDELYTTPETLFVAGFIGSPPMNLFSVNERGVSAFASGMNAGLTLGVRAEQLTISELVTSASLATLANNTDEALAGSSERLSLIGEVLLVEPAGQDRVVHLRVLLPDGNSAEAAVGESQTCAVRCGVAERPAVGSLVRVTGRRADVHVYDSASQQRLATATQIDIHADARLTTGISR